MVYSNLFPAKSTQFNDTQYSCEVHLLHFRMILDHKRFAALSDKEADTEQAARLNSQQQWVGYLLDRLEHDI